MSVSSHTERDNANAAFTGTPVAISSATPELSATLCPIPLDTHYFHALCQLLSLPSQSYLLCLDLSAKTLSYISQEKVILQFPFSHLLRLTTSPSALTLYMKGKRLGEVERVLHVISEAEREGLSAMFAHYALGNLSLLSSSLMDTETCPFPSTLAVRIAKSVRKRGKWGGDASRFACLMTHRLLIFRNQNSIMPINVIMMSDIVVCERKSGKRVRVKGEEREWELVFESERVRDDFVENVEDEKTASQTRLTNWRAEKQYQALEAQRERERERELEHKRSEKEEKEGGNSPLPFDVDSAREPTTPSSMNLSPYHDRTTKRRSMPSPLLSSVSAHVQAAKNKRTSLNIRTHRTMSPQLLSSSPLLRAQTSNVSCEDLISPVSPFPRNGQSPLSPSVRLPTSPTSFHPANLPSPSMISKQNKGHSTSPSPLTSRYSVLRSSHTPAMPVYSPPPVPFLVWNSLQTESLEEEVYKQRQLESNVYPSTIYNYASTTNVLPSAAQHYSRSLTTPLNPESNSLRYTLYVSGYDEPLGQISVLADKSLTLAHLRALMMDELDEVPDEFNFCDFDSNNVLVPVSLKQERTRFLDSIQTGSLWIRVKPTRSSLSDKNDEDSSTKMSCLHLRDESTSLSSLGSP